MDKRKEKILHTIIKEHIKTAAPVGSSCIAKKYKLNISPATARNEMTDLEKLGLIKQPHTSAGRVPTENAYQLYLENLTEKKLTDEEIKLFSNLLKSKNESSFKKTAKAIANISQAAVFWAFHKNNLYYTGISNLLRQPEFAKTNLIFDISAIIDRVDEIVDEIYDTIEEGPQILLGSDNPFANFCSTILAKYKVAGRVGMFGIIGPMRMDYQKNLALVKYINKVISNK